jgi:hypothetical protein
MDRHTKIALIAFGLFMLAEMAVIVVMETAQHRPHAVTAARDHSQGGATDGAPLDRSSPE